MLEFGCYNNGSNSLPIASDAEGVTFNDGSLAEVHAAAQQTIISQVRQGILAEKLGYSGFWLTEHHFQPEGAEMNPNPLMTQMAIAAHTKKIRLGQGANIITWHHPIRFAEQLATLDVVSGGRVDCGIGRGYQSRETEVLGRPYGATIQDQERNRASFDEAFDIIKKAWTNISFSHHGENFTIPPTYTKWNHKQTNAFFRSDKVERALDDVVKLGEPDMYSVGNAVLATTTTLKEIQVFPQPVQKPYPPIWQPLTSKRSIEWAAQHGVNGLFVIEPNDRLKRNIEVYHNAAEKAGWPDRLGDGRPFTAGWDGRRRRGLAGARYIHLAKGKNADRDIKRARASVELQFDFYLPFGFGAVLAPLDAKTWDLTMKVTADMMIEREVAIIGSPQEVLDKLMKLKIEVGLDDMSLMGFFELGGFEGREIEDQMQFFAEEVLPHLARECGGMVEFPEVGLDFVSEPESRSLAAE
jgi:alkanesulfonate monooxygenase SsuD/methylene tetrahydromethanopterin reductase-like flavin-dependent oxidoreductase (luciferase family)